MAPWKIPDQDDEFRRKFYNYKIDPTIKERVGKIIFFTADNEEEDGKKSLKIFHQVLGGEIIEIKGYGHYTFNDMGKFEAPEILEKIIDS